MKKFILLISMMLCVNQIKSWSFTDAALGVVSSARGLAGSHPAITCTGLGLWVVMSGINCYLPIRELLGKRREEQRRVRNSMLQDGNKEKYQYFDWHRQIVAFSKNDKLGYVQNDEVTEFTDETYNEKGSRDEADHLSASQHYYTLVSNGAIAALSLYGIYRTLFS